MKKIIHFTPRFYPLLGGIETHVDSIVKEITDKDFEIICKKIPNSVEYEKYLKNCVIRRFGPLELDNNVAIPWKIRLIHSCACEVIRVEKEKRYLLSQNYDLLHVHEVDIWSLLKLDILLRTNNFTKLATKIMLPLDNNSNKSSILTKHSLFSNEYDLKHFNKYSCFENKLISKFDNIICVDKHIFNYIKHNWTDKNIYFLPNFVDTDLFDFRSIEDGNKLNVGFIGRIDPIKGTELLTKLIHNIPPYLNLHLVLSGESYEIENIFNIPINKQNQVFLYNNISNKHLPAIIKKIDVLLNPINIPGISRTTLEAMSSGRPVIMLDIGDRYPVLDRENGFLIKNDVNALLLLLSELYDDRKQLRIMGYNARKKIQSEFSKEIIIFKLDAIYNSLI